MSFNNFALEQLALRKRGADIGLKSYLSTQFKKWLIDNVGDLRIEPAISYQDLRITRVFYGSGLALEADLVHSFDWSNGIKATFEYSTNKPDSFTISFVCRDFSAYMELNSFLREADNV